MVGLLQYATLATCLTVDVEVVQLTDCSIDSQLDSVNITIRSVELRTSTEETGSQIECMQQLVHWYSTMIYSSV